jgi:hypothetical protein
LEFLLTAGQAHDLAGADEPHMAASRLIADKAFDADARVLEPLARAAKSAVIPPRSNRLTRANSTDTCTRSAISSKISSENSIMAVSLLGRYSGFTGSEQKNAPR